ncbi:ArsR family transcriptional regulator [Pontibacillus halophilus JSM 076056 = DSM 19796]|uniref:ArsR family transcriptional regulator n=1 Tax=Pontibacillus halophilus JSM 076056 = DSM 19796 TaxID=1385510 RepID=A0A0A5I689_9BACI|nr:SRPBCC family protein [Pontibacillus halophilus]KGX91347.1 ArsR family transcriptional regulator [Pontibacillus halophilus JSM 076056 = DSM 19796]
MDRSKEWVEKYLKEEIGVGDLTYDYTIYINKETDVVWDAITTGESTQYYFFGRKVQSDWEIGSSIKYVKKDGSTDIEGEIVELEPSKRLEITWSSPESDDPPTRVIFTLQPYAEATKLIVIHKDLQPHYFVDRDDTFEGVNNGWPAILSNLKSYLETGQPMGDMMNVD